MKYTDERANIRDFEKVRFVLEKIYTDGFYTRKDIIENGFVGKTRLFDKTMRLLHDLYFLDCGEDENDWIENDFARGSYRFRRDYFSGAGKRLLASLGIYSITDLEIIKFISVMSLASGPNGTSVKELEDKIVSTAEGSNPNIIRTVKLLIEKGCLRKEGRRYYPDSCFEGLNDDDLVELFYLSAFYGNAGYPKAVFSFLAESVRREMMFRGMAQPTEAFFYRDNAFGNIFDEPTVTVLLECAKQHKVAEVTEIKQKNGKAVEKKRKVRPIWLRNDIRYGRWYLFCADENGSRIIRIAFLKDVSMTNESFDYEQVEKEISEKFRHSYLSHLGKPPVHFEAELHFERDPELAGHLRDQFEREMMIGRIENREGTEVYCVDVDNIWDIKPFLRSYSAYQRILPGTDPSIARELKEELERMLSAYETV